MYSSSADGADALRHLHHAAWYNLTREDSSGFQDIIKKAARDLAHRCSNVLAPLLLQDSNYERDLNTASVEKWFSKLEILEDLFASCVKLKARLPLRRRYFEFYLPTPQTRLKSSTMEADPTQGLVKKQSGIVLLPTSPAIFHYPKRRWKVDENDASAVMSLSDCIVRQEKERGDGTTICKASVLLQ